MHLSFNRKLGTPYLTFFRKTHYKHIILSKNFLESNYYQDHCTENALKLNGMEYTTISTYVHNTVMVCFVTNHKKKLSINFNNKYKTPRLKDDIHSTCPWSIFLQTIYTANVKFLFSFKS